MPTGKAGISGVVSFRSYPEIGDRQKREILDELSAFREKAGRGPLTGKFREQAWQKIHRVSAVYRGQLRAGLPITESERSKEINAIKKQAGVLASKLEVLPKGRRDRLRGHNSKLIRMIVSADLHSKDLLTKAMNREVNNLMETEPSRIRTRLGVLQTELATHRTLPKLVEQVEDLRELADQLKRLSVVDTSVVQHPKGEPNPYLAYFVRSLIRVWEDSVGELPSRTFDPYHDVEIFPFLDWANVLLSAVDYVDAGRISHHLARQELDLEKCHREGGGRPTQILA